MPRPSGGVAFSSPIRHPSEICETLWVECPASHKPISGPEPISSLLGIQFSTNVITLIWPDSTLASCDPYFMNSGDDNFRMLGWHLVAAVNNHLLAMGREASQLRL